jgi:hypothetical protein
MKRERNAKKAAGGVLIPQAVAAKSVMRKEELEAPANGGARLSQSGPSVVKETTAGIHG